MPPSQDSQQPQPCQGPTRHSRARVAQALSDFADGGNPHPSQRAFASEHDIPRSTLQHWLARPAPDDPEGAFLRSPDGEGFLRRVVLALHLVFHLDGPGGLRPLMRFLALTRLDRLVAPSFGAQHSLASCLESLLADYDSQQRQRLGALMPKRPIAVVADEHFHGPEPCLVAVEPVSNFLLAESYQPQRDAATWEAVLDEATKDLPVEVVVLTSDLAKGLLATAGDLEAQHSPDLFHFQRDLAAPLLAGLARNAQAAADEYDNAKSLHGKALEAYEQSQRQPRGPGRRRDYEGLWLPMRRRHEERTRLQLEQAQARQEEALAAVRGLSQDYHPFDLQTGQPVQAEQAQEKMAGRLEALEQLAEQAALAQKADEALARARKWLPALVGVVGWFWAKARALLAALALTEEERGWVEEKLLAGLYWRQAARRARTAEERQRLEEMAEGLLAQASSETGPLAKLSKERRAEVEGQARVAVGLFSRSSSCVEGRNGRLSLHHHGQTRLDDGRLAALTCLHNYFTTRADGSTAAQRFFGHKPDDLFDWLLARLPDLPRPAAKRPRAPTQTA